MKCFLLQSPHIFLLLQLARPLPLGPLLGLSSYLLYQSLRPTDSISKDLRLIGLLFL